MSEIVIERVSADDGRILTLLRRHFREGAQARQAWIYTGNPHGKALVWIASEQGQDVALVSIFPRRVVVQACRRPGALAGDCLVSPEARSPELMARLHRTYTARLDALGLDVVFGPPRPENIAGMQQAGFRQADRFRRWVRLLRGGLERKLRRLPGAAALAAPALWLMERAVSVPTCGHTLEAEQLYGEDLDRLFDRVQHDHAAVCVRDAAYLRWRYLRAPHGRQQGFALRRGGELRGFASCFVRQESLVVVDLLCPLHDRLPEIALQLLAERAGRLGCTTVEMALAAPPVLHRRLLRCGFLPRERWSFLVAAAPGPLHERGAWLFTDGDQDFD